MKLKTIANHQKNMFFKYSSSGNGSQLGLLCPHSQTPCAIALGGPHTHLLLSTSPARLVIQHDSCWCLPTHSHYGCCTTDVGICSPPDSNCCIQAPYVCTYMCTYAVHTHTPSLICKHRVVSVTKKGRTLGEQLDRLHYLEMGHS